MGSKESVSICFHSPLPGFEPGISHLRDGRAIIAPSWVPIRIMSVQDGVHTTILTTLIYSGCHSVYITFLCNLKSLNSLLQILSTGSLLKESNEMMKVVDEAFNLSL